MAKAIQNATAPHMKARASTPDENALLERVPADGAAIGNGTLRRALDWSQQRYERARDALLEKQVLKRAPGRGGSVKLAGAASDEEQLLSNVPPDGSAIGNTVLQRKLGWREERYWQTRDRLLDEGVLERGRGRGGTVRFVEPRSTAPRPASDPVQGSNGGTRRSVTEPLPTTRVAEEEFYDRIERVLRSSWAKHMRFTWCHIETTAKQGRRATGGKWSRPDLTAISLDRYRYVPGEHLEVWTFEVKTLDQLDVTAVYEALAHARRATRSYVLVVGARAKVIDAEERLRVATEEAERHGIGLFVVEDPDDFERWDERAEPERLKTDLKRLNDFIAEQLSEEACSDLRDQMRR